MYQCHPCKNRQYIQYVWLWLITTYERQQGFLLWLLSCCQRQHSCWIEIREPMILLYIKDQGQTMHARAPAGFIKKVRTMLKVCLSALTLSNCFSGCVESGIPTDCFRLSGLTTGNNTQYMCTARIYYWHPCYVGRYSPMANLFLFPYLTKTISVPSWIHDCRVAPIYI